MLHKRGAFSKEPSVGVAAPFTRLDPPMQRVLDRGPPPSVTLTTPEATQDATAASEFQDATAADDDFRWRFSGTTIPDDPKARDQACHHVPKRARPDLCSGSLLPRDA